MSNFFLVKKNTEQNHAQDAEGSLFIYLLLLTLLFLTLEVAFFVQWFHFYLGDYELIAHHLSIPPIVLPGIGFFVVVQLGLHFLYAVAMWALARLIGIALSLRWHSIEKVGFLLWALGIVTLLLANQYFFPNSKFSTVVSILISPSVGEILLMVLALFFTVVGFIALIGLFIWSRWTFFICLLLSVIGAWLTLRPTPVYATSSPKPNLIIIGIDSLRPDFLSYFGGEVKTDHIDNFLNQAQVFTKAITPLARTFPAWVSLLTGEYPKHHGMRTNNEDQSTLDYSQTLPSLLKQAGYTSLFATDETRFSNIDERFGFDTVITPPIGFNDFLLGTLNDFPLSNMLINTWVGRYLFPNSYANRGAFTTYNPDTFIRFIESHLNNINNRPIFMAVHFCLAHYPYLWGNHPAEAQSIQDYHAALKRVDTQFDDFMRLLAAHHLMDNSVIVLVSDHGEALELSGDRVTKANLYRSANKSTPTKPPHFYPASFSGESVEQSAGHGTDVLGMSQEHVLMAFQFHNKRKYLAKRIDDPVSLLDIKPTLMSYLNLENQERKDGISLLSVIEDPEAHLKTRDLLIESDFSPEAVRTIHPEMRKVLFEGIDYFKIDPKTGRVIVKPEMLKLIMGSKQYADLYQNWMLALYPKNETTWIPILVNLQTGEWTDDLKNSFAINSPGKHMLLVLKHFYGKDICNIDLN